MNIIGSGKSTAYEGGGVVNNTSSNDQINDLLREELEHTKKKKKETEDQLLNLKRENVELKLEVNRVSKELEETNGDRARHDASISTINDLELQVRFFSIIGTIALSRLMSHCNDFTFILKLAQKSSTVNALEEKLQEKESVVNRLEQDKNKLENYSKQVSIPAS